MRRKKGVSIFLVLLFVLSLIIAGCGGNKMQLNVEKQQEPQQQEEQQK